MKKILYWMSVVIPIIDLIRGAVDGVKKGLKDIEERSRYEEEERFRRANGDKL